MKKLLTLTLLMSLSLIPTNQAAAASEERSQEDAMKANFFDQGQKFARSLIHAVRTHTQPEADVEFAFVLSALINAVLSSDDFNSESYKSAYPILQAFARGTKETLNKELSASDLLQSQDKTSFSLRQLSRLPDYVILSSNHTEALSKLAEDLAWEKSELKVFYSAIMSLGAVDLDSDLLEAKRAHRLQKALQIEAYAEERSAGKYRSGIFTGAGITAFAAALVLAGYKLLIK